MRFNFARQALRSFGSRGDNSGFFAYFRRKIVEIVRKVAMMEKL
jgi:hypothetical protein